METILIKIPFKTKGKKDSKRSWNIMKGNAYFVFSVKDQKIIHEYLQLDEANYRLTDWKHFEQLNNKKGYYLKENTRLFRKNFLDPITNHIDDYDSFKINSSEYNKYYSTTKYKFNILEEVKIKEINQFLQTENNTIKNQFSYFTGSNIAGAETNNKASPLLCMEQVYFGCNFLNPIKKITSLKLFQPYKIIAEVSLEQFIINNYAPNFNQEFKNYNQFYFNDIIFNLDENNQLEKDDLKKIKKVKISFENSIKELSQSYLNSYLRKEFVNMDDASHKRMLRTLYSAGVNKLLREEKIPFNSTNEEYKSNVIQNAHIVRFGDLVNKKEIDKIQLAINPYNVMRINSDNHILFDKHQITFDLSGNMLDRNGTIIKYSYLKMEKIPEQSKIILKENYSYWKNNKENK